MRVNIHNPSELHSAGFINPDASATAGESRIWGLFGPLQNLHELLVDSSSLI